MRAWTVLCSPGLGAMPFTSAPCFPPRLIFGWPQTIAGKVAIVQAHQFRFHHLDETCATLLRYMLRGAPSDESGRGLLVHSTANDRRNGFGDQHAMMQTEWVRCSQRLAHR